MPHISVREYATLSVGDTHAISLDEAYISATAFDHLCTLYEQFNRSGATLLQLAGRNRLKLDQFVGVIQTPCGTCIEVLPKHTGYKTVEKTRILLQTMLAACLQLSPREIGAAQLLQNDLPLHEWVMQQFLAQFNTLLQRGIRSDYVRIEEESTYLRGQLDMTKQMRQPVTKAHLFNIKHDILSFDRPENRLLRTALLTICKATNNPNNWRLAHELRLLTHEIPNSTRIKHDFAQWRNQRLTTHYQAIKPWCELVLGQHLPAFMGNQRGMSMLFDMNKLFEGYVASCIQKILPPPYSLHTQVSSEHLCASDFDDTNAVLLKPDMLIRKNSAAHTILDTKWKLLTANSNSASQNNHQPNKLQPSVNDAYQMFAYSHAYLQHEGLVILVYPQTASFKQRKEFVFKETNATLWMIPFDLDQSALVGGLPMLGE